ncbi:DUF1194 domain-containing protein [Dongia sp.]|uniref:DUF1194 domain-containing protein n=1 Tax=Dongia sp. TaxID=1977262 RepID=UPI003753E476
MRRTGTRRYISAGVAFGLALLAGPAADAAPEMVDTALVLAVDVSQSVNDERFALQMDGIAKAFEDPEVQRSILSGPHRAIFVTMVEWSDKAAVAVPWTLIASAEDAVAFAATLRKTPRKGAEFTCMSRALQLIGDKILPFLPMPANRTVIDVSSDGHDNCNLNPPVDVLRDALVADGVTINGLPILEGDEAATLEAWYKAHVIGGASSFTVPAHGYKDFERAMRRKFVTEISQLP